MKTKSILLTAASVLASASLAWAQDNAPAPEAPAAPAAVAPAIPPPTPPVAPVPAVAPALPTPPAPSAGSGGGGGGMTVGSTTGGGGGGGGGLTISSSAGGGGGVIKITRDGVILTRPITGPDTTVDVVTSTTQDLTDEVPEPPEVNAGMMEEEGQLNLDAAIKRYQQTIARFDSRRSATAQAIFRLGECYRKMGRMEEAKVQYARILREFPDQEALVKSSQAYLFGNSNRNFNTRLEKIVKRREPIITKKESKVTTTEQSVSSAGTSPEHYGEVASSDALQGNFDQELAVMQKQIAEAQQKFKLGVVPQTEVANLQRDLLKLQREKIASAMAADRLAMQTLDPTTGLPVVSSVADAKAQSDLELIRREVAKAELESLLKEREADEATVKEGAVRQKVNRPELLGSVLGTDPIYMKLKGEYEMARLNASGADAGADEKKKAELTLTRLCYYVSDICLPQLVEMKEYAQRKLEFSKEIAKTIKKHLNEMESAQDPFQHAPSAMPKPEHAPDAAPNSPTPSPAPIETR